MLKVNQQLHVFFQQMSDNSYPRKMVRVTMQGYLVIGVVSNFLRVLIDYLGLHKIWWYGPSNILLLYEQFFLFMQTLFFLYLADVRSDDDILEA